MLQDPDILKQTESNAVFLWKHWKFRVKLHLEGSKSPRGTLGEPLLERHRMTCEKSFLSMAFGPVMQWRFSVWG